VFYSQVEGGRLVYLAPTHRSRDEDEILANLDLDAGADLGSRRRRRAETGDNEGAGDPSGRRTRRSGWSGRARRSSRA